MQLILLISFGAEPLRGDSLVNTDPTLELPRGFETQDFWNENAAP